MAMQRKNYQATTDEGVAIPSPLIDVFISGTLDRAELFSDDLISPTPLANPFTGDSAGRFGFYTLDGIVDIVVHSLYTLEAELFDYTLGDTPLDSAIESINDQTEALQTIEIGTAGVDATITSAGGVHTIDLPSASGAARGLLIPTHWTLFNSAIRSLAGLSGNTITMTIGSAGTDANIAPLGTNITINLPTASAVNRGLLSAANWTAFNAKQAAFAGTTLQYVRGDASLATLNTAIVPEVTNLYFTTARARTSISATAPVAYNSSTGVVSMAAATGAVNGYLTAANFTIFNNKLGTLNTLTAAAQTFAVGTTGTDVNISSVTSVHTFNFPDASASARGLVTTGTQTIAGAKTLSGRLTTGSGRNIKTRVHIASGDVTITTADDVVIVNKTVAAASTVNLPGSPTAGDVYCIKDGKGDGAANPLTITPAAGTIDGAGSFATTANYEAVWVIFNGTEWNVV